MLLFIEPTAYMFDYREYEYDKKNDLIIINNTIFFDTCAEDIFSSYIHNYNRKVGGYSPLVYVPIHILSMQHSLIPNQDLKYLTVSDVIDKPEDFRFRVEFGSYYEIVFNGNLAQFLEEHEEGSDFDYPNSTYSST